MPNADGAANQPPNPRPNHNAQRPDGWVEVPIRYPQYDDEISLRDLYLILKSALPLILIVAVVAGAAGAGWSLLQTPTYETSSTVSIGAAPVRASDASEGGLTFQVERPLDTDSYTRIALSDAVLSEVLSALPAGTIHGEDPVGTLRSSIEVANTGVQERLVMEHIASHEAPEQAVAVANAWAVATLESVRENLLNTFDGVAETTSQELNQRRDQLVEAQLALQAFEQQNIVPLLTQRENQLTQAVAASEQRLVTIDVELAIERARLESTLGLLANEPRVIRIDDVLNASELAAAFRGETASIDAVRIDREALNPSYTQLLEVQIEASTKIAGLEAERKELMATLEQRTNDLREVRDERTNALREQEDIQREYAEAEQAFRRISGLEPTITYLANLTTTGSRILTSANLPNSPTRSLSPTLAALLGAIVGGMAATLFAFLREAVKPEETAEPAVTPGTANA